MKISIQESVTVITPTTGRQSLWNAVDSVMHQSYSNINHLIVADGVDVFDDTLIDRDNVWITKTPWQTGANGFYGHKIYAAYPQLVNSKYTAFLDDDNWYERDHIESLVNLVESKGLDWAHSLRKVYLNEADGGTFLDNDNCEAIGRYPIWFTKNTQNEDFLVDTSCFLFKTDFLKSVAHHWNWGWGADRRFFNIVHKHLGHDNFDCTGLHTLNYLLPPLDQAYGGDREFFAKGNKKTLEHYNGTYPWTKV